MTRHCLVAATMGLLLGGCVEDLAVLDRPRDAGVPGDADVGTDAGAPDAGPPDAGPGAGPQAPGRTLAAGDHHTCAIVGGTLWCWGDNDDGQLGTGDRTGFTAPEPIGAASDWVQIGAGATHSCGTRADGTVWCWGGNTDGQLGVGDTTSRDAPVEVSTAPAPWLLATSQDHVCVVDQTDALWCWGQNGEGEIGLDDWPPVFVLEPTRVGDAADWTWVSTGQGSTLGLRDGTLYGWGRNSDYQLGLGVGAPAQRRVPTFVADGPFARVSAGQNHSCAIDAGGDLWCWGNNFAGQLGTGDRTDRPTPEVIDAGGDWTEISVDTFHGCGLREPGTLWCWGRNVEGQLGTGDLMDRLVPTRVGDADDWVAVDVGRFHTCAQRADESVWCTGENGDGRLGTGDLDRRNELTRADVIL